jgi:hypothetical protein
MAPPPHDEPPLPESIWNLLRRDEPDPGTLQAAYRRFVTRPPERVSAFRVVRWLAVGFVAGGSVAFAATGVPALRARLWRPLHLTARGGEAPTVARPPAPPLRRAAPESAPLPAASVAPPLPPSDSARPAGETSRGVVLAEPPTADPKWQRAAATLKAHDYSAAENALRELETTGTPSDRDAASLALAQVLLTRGRTVEARARLERLNQRAGSALVREKAAALLAELSAPGERSGSGAPVPH